MPLTPLMNHFQGPNATLCFTLFCTRRPSFILDFQVDFHGIMLYKRVWERRNSLETLDSTIEFPQFINEVSHCYSTLGWQGRFQIPSTSENIKNHHCATWESLSKIVQPFYSIIAGILLLLLSRFSRVRLCETHRRQPARLPCPWDSPGKNTGVGCHFLLQCM